MITIATHSNVGENFRPRNMWHAGDARQNMMGYSSDACRGGKCDQAWSVEGRRHMEGLRSVAACSRRQGHRIPKVEGQHARPNFPASLSSARNSPHHGLPACNKPPAAISWKQHGFLKTYLGRLRSSRGYPSSALAVSTIPVSLFVPPSYIVLCGCT